MKSKEKKTEEKMGTDIQELWDTYRKYNTGFMKITKGEEREKGTEEMFKVTLAENCPKLMSYTKSNIQESRISTKKNLTCRRNIYTNCRKSKTKKILKEARMGKNT